MTVKELCDILTRYPSDTRVLVEGDSGKAVDLQAIRLEAFDQTDTDEYAQAKVWDNLGSHFFTGVFLTRRSKS